MAIIAEAVMRPSQADRARVRGANAIEAEGLRKEFPGGIVAVAGIDLPVCEGEVFDFPALRGRVR